MARYLLLLHVADANLRDMPAPDKQALFDRFVVWSESLKTRGHLQGVESLMDDGGKTIRKKRDQIVVDGPFAEMKELVTGLFVIEADDAVSAGAIAAECPWLAVGGAIELREIALFPVRP